jgi:hypothetical protein
MRRIVLFAAVVLSGCYSYTPITSPAPGVGSDVRVDLTDLGSAQLANTVGQRVGAIDGRTVSASDTSLTLTVAQTISHDGTVAHWNDEQVVIPRGAIARIQGRRLDTGRTYLASAVTVAGAFVVGKIFGLGNGLGGFISHGGGSGKQ